MADDPQIAALRAAQDCPKFSFEGTEFWTRVVDVYDGDSFKILVPFNGALYSVMTRALGIDTAELASKSAVERHRAIEARDHAISWVLPAGAAPPPASSKKDIKLALSRTPAIVYARCHDFDLYGRVLVVIHRSKDGGEPTLNDDMLSSGHAVAYEGGTKTHDWTTV